LPSVRTCAGGPDRRRDDLAAHALKMTFLIVPASAGEAAAFDDAS
jgi:hypothetical protein